MTLIASQKREVMAARVALYGFGWMPIVGKGTTAFAKNIIDKHDQTLKEPEFDLQAMKIINIVCSVLTLALLVTVVVCPVLNFLIIPFWITYCATDLLGAAWKLYKGDGSLVVQLGKLGVNALVIGLAMHAMPFLIIGYEAVRLADRCVELKKGRGFLDQAEDACQVATSELLGRFRSEKRAEPVADSRSSSEAKRRTKPSDDFDQTVEEMVREQLPTQAEQLELAKAMGIFNALSFQAKVQKPRFQRSGSLKELVSALSTASQKNRLKWVKDSRFQPFFSSLLDAPNELTLRSLLNQNQQLMAVLNLRSFG